MAFFFTNWPEASYIFYFFRTLILKLNSTAHIIFIDIYIKLYYEDSGKPGAQRGACGTNGVLVGDRIEFDREYI